MGIPRLHDHSQELTTRIEEQLANSTVTKYEILTESQAMMSDLETDIANLQGRRNKVVGAVTRNKENMRRLALLIEHDENLSQDLDTQIHAKLESIHALRERGVTLPPKEKSKQEGGDA